MMDETKLVLGRGEIYFDRFADGTRTGVGERYIGNSESFVVDRKFEFAESKSSIGGVKSKRFKDTVGEETILSFITDNMSIENLADWLGGDASTVSFLPTDGWSESFTLVPGRFYQLGLPTFPATGARNLFALVVTVDGTPINDLYVDEVNGRFGIPAGRTDLIGATGVAEYEIKRSKSDQVILSNKAVRGALRFISKNPHGEQGNFYFPHVLLAPKDQLALKGDNWRTLTFEADVLAKMRNYGPGKATLAPGEIALLSQGIALLLFPYLENILNQAVNGIV